MDIFDAGNDKAYFAGLEVGRTGMFRIEYSDAIDLVHLAGGLDQDLVTLLDPAMANADQRDNTEIVVEPGVDDQSLQRRIDFAGWRRNDRNQTLKHIVYAHAAFGAASHCVGRIDADDMFDFVLDLIGVGLRQVHLIQHWHNFQALLNSRVTVGYRLRFYALPRIDHQQRTLAGGQRATDLVGEVNVTWSVDKVQLISFAILRFVVQRDAVRLDGDASFALEIHRIKHLSVHFTLGQTAAHLNKTVSQGRLAMIDVRDDGKIADMTQVAHSSTL